MSKLDLIRKTETYYDDISKTGERISFPRFAAGFAALLSYIIWGTSFSDISVIVSGRDRSKRKGPI